MHRAPRPETQAVPARNVSASVPATMAAVAAALASAQLTAATLAVRHGPCAGNPVRGSMMWWTGCPFAAIAGRSPTTWPGRRRRPDNLARRPAGGVRDRPAWIARVCDGHRPAAARRQPGDGDVASQVDRVAPLHAGPACRRGRAVGSESLGRRAEIQDDPAGQPRAVLSSVTDRLRAQDRTRRATGADTDGREITVIWLARSARPVGSVTPRVHRAAVSATRIASARPSLS